MYQKQIKLKPETPDSTYTDLCDIMQKQDVFVACGSCDDKWILGKWENEMDFAAWLFCCISGFDVQIKEIEDENNRNK